MRFQVENPDPKGQLSHVVPTMMQLQRGGSLTIRGVSTDVSGNHGLTEITARLTFDLNSEEALATLFEFVSHVVLTSKKEVKMSGSIEQKWQRLLACFPEREAMTDKQVQDVERIFFAGASSVFQILMEMPDTSPPAITVRFTELYTEILAYMQTMQRQIAKEAAAIDE